jgi:hypothetical protein
MIHAKPIIPDQYWILRDDQGKIGNIEVDRGSYVVSINGEKSRFHNLDSLRHRLAVTFDHDQKPVSTDLREVHGYPTSDIPYNAVFDVSKQIPLWTQKPKSRSWLAAGYYRVKPNRNWRVVFCPKLILLQRYQYQGPYRTREEASPQ